MSVRTRVKTWRTGRATARAIPRIVAALRAWGVSDVLWFLAYEGAPVLWLATETDAERSEVAAHGCFAEDVRAFLAEAGVPQDFVAKAVVTVESQESVDREWRGNWWHAMK